MKVLFVLLALLALLLLGIIAYILYGFYKKYILMPSYPLPNYHFRVEWGGTEIRFSEVSGLSVETDVIEVRSGNSNEFHTQKMPGLHKFSNVTLKRGLVKQDNAFFEWIANSLGNRPERRDVVITLLSSEHEPVFAWRLIAAFPVKYTGPELNAKTSEVAMEELVLAYESFNMQAL